MLAEVPDLVTTLPAAPENFTKRENFGCVTVRWNRSKERNDGSWVISYDVFVDGNLQSRVYGNQFHGKLSKQDLESFEVKAVNALGTSSAAAKFSSIP